MRVLDRYLLREVLTPILICSITLVFLVLIADLFDNLDSLLKNQTPLGYIFRYYLMLTPFAFTQTIPWATLLGTLYLLVTFNLHNEIVAMKVAGIEIMVIIRPIVFLGFLIGIFSFLVGEYMVPQTFQIAREIRDVHIEKKRGKEEEKAFQNVTYFSGGKQLQYYRSFDYGKKEVQDAILLWLDPQGQRTRRKMVARKGTWDPQRGWLFENVTEYEMDPQGQILGEPRIYVTKVYSDVQVKPEDLRFVSSESSFLSLRELKYYMKKLEENGIKPHSEKVEYQSRFASPWYSLVMILIAIPLLSPTRSKKIIALNVLICLGIVFAFHVVGAMAFAMGKSGTLPPFLSVWLNSFLFGGAAVFFMERANE